MNTDFCSKCSSKKTDTLGMNCFVERTGKGVQFGDFRYSSSIDPINDLYAHYAFDDRKTGLPIVILMHGYVQDSAAMNEWIMHDMASYGFFACAVGMRGRDGASGEVDVSGRELHDIVDAVEYIKNNFAYYVDENNVNVSGYSGGGGNVFGLAAKFPDYFNVLVSHFGISDYGYDGEKSWWVTNSVRRKSMKNWIGYTPDENVGAYHSRAHNLGVGKNYKGGHLFIFHDRNDSNVPPVQSEIVKEQMDLNGLDNYTLSISESNDNPRWLHNNPRKDQPVRLTRDLYWGPILLNKTYCQWSVSDIGTMLVQGYLKTKKFEVWLGNGQEHVAELFYDVKAKSYTLTPLTGEVEVTIKQGNEKVIQRINEQTAITL